MGIPIPVSFTETKTLLCLSLVSMVMVELSCENLIALSKRLYKTCWILSTSAWTSISSPVRIRLMEICFFRQVPSKVSTVLRMTRLILKSESSKTIPLVLRLLSVRRELVSLVRRSVSFNTILRYFSCSSTGMVPSIMASR